MAATASEFSFYLTSAIVVSLIMYFEIYERDGHVTLNPIPGIQNVDGT